MPMQRSMTHAQTPAAVPADARRPDSAPLIRIDGSRVIRRRPNPPTRAEIMARSDYLRGHAARLLMALRISPVTGAVER